VINIAMYQSVVGGIIITTYLGGENTAGGKLKETGTMTDAISRYMYFSSSKAIDAAFAKTLGLSVRCLKD
jgi:hypothetical protein